MPGRSILVFGGLGQVGQALAALDGDVVTLPRQQADLTYPEAVAAALDRHHPAAVINCAVFQPVDRCEKEPAGAFEVNTLAVGTLAVACAERGLSLIHLSTDYVFDGAKSEPYSERDCPKPRSVYAASKLGGEHLALVASNRHWVVRTSSVYGCAAPGHGNMSFVERMLQRAQAGIPTQVVVDQIVSPTYAGDLAAALLRLVRRDAGGVVHLAGATPCSWYELARQVFALAGRSELLSPITARQHGASAPRPAYSALTSERLDDLGFDPLPGWQDGLDRHFQAAHPEVSTAPGK